MTYQRIKIGHGDPVGIIGLGRMGHGIALNLTEAGFGIHGLEHAGNQPLQDLLDTGAVLHASIAELVAHTRFLIICVTGSDEVEQIMCGDGGVLMSAVHPLMIMDCSTGLPEKTRTLHDKAGINGHYFFDAAMTRTPKEAAEGRLNLIIGGDAGLRQHIDPVLSPIAEVVTMAGGIGKGQEAKLIHNFVSLGFSAILAEAAARADHGGISREIFLELIGNGGGGGVVFERFLPYLKNEDRLAFNFTISNAIKDLRYFQQSVGEDSLNTAILSLYEDAERNDDTIVPELIDHITAHLRSD